MTRVLQRRKKKGKLTLFNTMLNKSFYGLLEILLGQGTSIGHGLEEEEEVNEKL